MWLRGSPDSPALTLGGRTLSYRQFADEIARLELPASGSVDASSVDPLRTLTLLYAAITRGRPVIIADPAHAVDTIDEPPPGTFLVAVTSGSSGHPRPVARTAASWTDSFAPLAELAGLRATDTVGLTGPLHSTLHLFGAMHTLWLGAHLTEATSEATAVHCVPTVLMSLLATRPSRLRSAVVAGAALPDHVTKTATAQGISLLEYYGATELSFVAARQVPRPMRAFPGVELDLRSGVLWSRSPYTSLGYVGVDGPLLVDAEGFATVGDLATLSSDGDLIVRGRSDAAILTGGSTVIAEDVESVLMSLPGVRSAAVVGRPHPRLGQVVIAVLQLATDTDIATVRALARRSLRAEALPRRWHAVDKMPTTSTGKVARTLVARGIADGSLLTRPAIKS
ncbi:acyl-CoA synthetase (AMP-forming)/AMP-acid ligase II [Antricoccus suffuscus]|uniref:Acyl-CoA synthetase (AMP-forming)/AMP-acid ligase II n=1 Tax=Antricoccus suffuscus TaxID=1629062 RepID=A0A2T1A515_9ACTN|nr:acyl-CoA synthetase (AMP-forming)/AMP-acid ligase II [Antricoccus suffuscus]